MPQPSISRRGSWNHFKKNVFSLIVEALLLLRSRTDLIEKEKPLNRALRLCFRSANYKLGLEYFPSLDAENATDDIEKEGGKPDLTWSFYNDQADNPEDCELIFALECKRLGVPTSPNWKLTEQYVKDGLLRFFNEEKGYSQDCGLGAMVGYLQNMDFDTALQEINSYITASPNFIPTLSNPQNGWQPDGVNYMQHCFLRPFSPPIFCLDHFWLDLRDHYTTCAQDSPDANTALQRNSAANDRVSLSTMLKNRNGEHNPTPKNSVESTAQLTLPLD